MCVIFTSFVNAASSFNVISLGVFFTFFFFSYPFSPACKGLGMRKESFLLREVKTSYTFSVQAVRKNTPILIDAERPREGLDDLLKLADYVVCSANFPAVSALFSLKVLL